MFTTINRTYRRTAAVLLAAFALTALAAPLAALGPDPGPFGPDAAAAAVNDKRAPAKKRNPARAGNGVSIEDAADNAKTTGQTTARAVIGLALAVGAAVCVFTKNFKEAALLVALGLLGFLLTTDDGVATLSDTARSVLGLG